MIQTTFSVIKKRLKKLCKKISFSDKNFEHSEFLLRHFDGKVFIFLHFFQTNVQSYVQWYGFGAGPIALGPKFRVVVVHLQPAKIAKPTKKSKNQQKSAKTDKSKNKKIAVRQKQNKKMGPAKAKKFVQKFLLGNGFGKVLRRYESETRLKFILMLKGSKIKNA